MKELEIIQKLVHTIVIYHSHKLYNNLSALIKIMDLYTNICLNSNNSEYNPKLDLDKINVYTLQIKDEEMRNYINKNILS